MLCSICRATAVSSLRPDASVITTNGLASSMRDRPVRSPFPCGDPHATVVSRRLAIHRCCSRTFAITFAGTTRLTNLSIHARSCAFPRFLVSRGMASLQGRCRIAPFTVAGAQNSLTCKMLHPRRASETHTSPFRRTALEPGSNGLRRSHGPRPTGGPCHLLNCIGHPAPLAPAIRSGVRASPLGRKPHDSAVGRPRPVES